MKLHINTSAIFQDDAKDQIQDSSITISISKTKTLAHLKSMISKKIAIPANNFTISRQNVTRHLKDLNLTMVQHGLTSGALLQVRMGEARVEGQYAIDVSFVWLLQEEDRKKDEQPDGKDGEKANDGKKKNKSEKEKEEQFFDKKMLGTITVEAGTTISSFKKQIFDELIVKKAL